MKIRTRTNTVTASSFQIINYCLFLLMFRHQTGVMEDIVINLGVISRCSHKHWIRILASCLRKLAAKNFFFSFLVVIFIVGIIFCFLVPAIHQLRVDQSLYKNWLFILCSAATDGFLPLLQQTLVKCCIIKHQLFCSWPLSWQLKGKKLFFLKQKPINVTGELSEIIKAIGKISQKFCLSFLTMPCL